MPYTIYNVPDDWQPKFATEEGSQFLRDVDAYYVANADKIRASREKSFAELAKRIEESGEPETDEDEQERYYWEHIS